MELIIKNGYVYDPKNGIDGEIKDIMVKDGKIVDNVSKEALEIDAKNKVVMPGGVDHHTHIAGSKVCVGRMLRPEDIRRNPDPMAQIPHIDRVMMVKRGGGGFSVMPTWTTGYRYAQMGYTTCFDPAFAPMGAKHLHEEFERTPLIDKGGICLMGNNWMIMEYLHDGELEKAAAYVSWLLNATKAYGIKIVNPGGVEAWSWGKNITSGRDPVPYFNLTSNEIIKGLAEINEMLELPHSIHLHGNNLGHPGNWDTFIDNADAALDVSVNTVSEREQVVHATHVQFYSYGGESWKDFSSKADAIADYINKTKNITIDVGFVTLDETTTMTGDGPMEYNLYSTTNLKWANNDVGLECGSGLTPFIYNGKNPVNAIQWAAGLELALLIDDPWKVLFGTDHPNGGPFIRYPDVFSWLMSKKARDEKIAKINKSVRRNAIIESLDREYTLYEIATITRAANAKVLGLTEKGHLGIGADADIAIYNLDPEKDKLNDPETIKKAFMKTHYTIKGGEIVVKEGRIVNPEHMGKTYIVESEFGDKEIYKDMLNDLEMKFKKYYAMQKSTYWTGYEYVPHRKTIKVGYKGD
ncbi:MAG: formylmethanofuran dehydrogenase subunit [Methanothermococcus sp.]|jgi:formylmethanofuran dehydrogenase subunit A|uniref:Tungsten formylmethanofuran dehydrogenase subunit A n=1 Tax=Methanococcus maripaludis KA1 TaxID=637914 RepID=A0A2Z5PMS4_METMI|nr:MULTISPECIES: formylmethanofuran dehydrogenase subunit A [Methanococcaceae]MDK2790399.1 formylmethanofuran dehydrogenase subunit [Methanothermococcus sp.]MDK2987490.1 formylmethanofuran dehydrogenase subunit [Methanothermococcus sp.]BAP61204.1 tungsten formylmethanofuran dehydrogenase subunit A [Methanococcus maripaludis KA1]